MRDTLEKFAIGCLIDTNFGPYNQPEPDRDTVKRCIDQLVEEGIIAEQAGFDGVFVQECHMHTETMFPNPLLLLAALAARTERIRLGTYALIPGYGWNPMHLAESTALVDQLSGGRLILGVALGLIEESFRMFGVDSKYRVSLFTEAIDVLKQAWTSTEPFSYRGKRYRFDEVFLTPKPYQQNPHPAIWGGAQVDEAIRRVGSFATAYCSDPFPLQIETWNRQTDLFRETAAAHGGGASQNRPDAGGFRCRDARRGRAYLPGGFHGRVALLLRRRDPQPPRSDHPIPRRRHDRQVAGVHGHRITGRLHRGDRTLPGRVPGRLPGDALPLRIRPVKRGHEAVHAGIR